MPSWYPENNVLQAGDNEHRVIAKWCDEVFASVGNVPCQFPEGTRPLPGDNEDRLLDKIAIMSNQ